MENSIQLFTPDQVMPEAVADYLTRNRAFLTPWLPEQPEEYYTAAHWKRLLRLQEKEMEEGQAVYFYISEAFGADRVIGSICLTDIIMGAFCSAYMGYRLDAERINRSYMTEAVKLVTDYAFNELGLHRIEANVMPRNVRSLRVLKKCGFREEGLARKYLKINGVWEDHLHMVRLSDDDGTVYRGI